VVLERARTDQRDWDCARSLRAGYSIMGFIAVLQFGKRQISRANVHDAGTTLRYCLLVNITLQSRFRNSRVGGKNHEHPALSTQRVEREREREFIRNSTEREREPDQRVMSLLTLL